MPSEVGYSGEMDHDALIRLLIDVHDHWRQQLSTRFQEMASDTKLYLGYREDRRQAHEKWRSWSWLGDPFQQTETEANAWLEIMNSTDPSFAVEGVGVEDEWKARAIEREVDYILRGNKWIGLQASTYRVVSYQGMRVLKPGWKEIKYAPMRRPSKEELIKWDEALNEALKTGKVTSPPDPKSEPEEFQGWMQATQEIVPGFPDVPIPQPSEQIQYRGPWFTPVSNFDLVYDPFTENWPDHEIVFQRIVKPREWGEQQVKEGKFDGEQFKKAARKGPEDNRLSQWDRQISSQIGLVQDDNDPRWKNSDEYLEVWRPQDQKAPHLVILNRSAIVNTSTVHPYWHRQLPYICIKNNPQPGHAIGIGSYAQLRRTFHDRLTFRDLLLDGLLLSVMPIFLKSRNMGMSEMQRFMQPGMILEVNDPNGFKPGWQGMPGFSELLRVGQELMNDQNTILSTGDNVRGQTSTVGRVSATESQQRLTQALVRHKQKAQRLEEEETPLLSQALELVYQFLPEDDPQMLAIRQAIVGEDERLATVAPEFTRETFAEKLAQNVRFRGATSKLNKELAAQQLKDIISMASQLQGAAGIPTPVMSPQEVRNALRRVFDLTAQKGINEVFTAEGDAAVAQMLQAHMIQAQTAPKAAQLQDMNVQAQMQQLMNPQPQIDPATGQPIQAQPGNGQAPPEQMQEEQGVQAQA